MVATAAAIVALSASPAPADCVAPSISAPRTVLAGEDLVVTGEEFAAECNDTGSGCVVPRRSPPLTDVAVDLSDGFDSVASTVVDANEDYAFEARLPVPAGAAPGMYHVTVARQNDVGMLGTAKVRVRSP